MSPFHPTKRDLLLVLSCFLVLGLLLQFDFSLRFDYIRGRNEWEESRPIRNGNGAHKDKWMEEVESGAKSSSGRVVAPMGESKLRWGEAGPVRTQVLGHAPGWTIFDQIYLYNGTWFIVTDNPSSIPLLRLMTSTGKEIWNDEDSIKGREPTEQDMRIIFPSEAKKLFGGSASRVSGASFLVNDPPQFLDHYYQ
jgi:hypothetical protein